MISLAKPPFSTLVGIKGGERFIIIIVVCGGEKVCLRKRTDAIVKGQMEGGYEMIGWERGGKVSVYCLNFNSTMFSL